MTLNVVGAWAFPSSSGSTTYETTLDEVATLSCNCPGFIFKRAGQERGCKHTRQVAPFVESILLGKLTALEVAERLGIAGSNTTTPIISVQPKAQQTKSVASSSSKTEKKGRLIDFEE
ncbi:MAG: hypothetical protein NT023_03340 [Armatimonadetes bacterium]|nr:hypothetical protein [Armatimonadota bacterium]